MRPVDRIDSVPTLQGGRRHEQHGQIHRTRHHHGQPDIPAGDLEQQRAPGAGLRMAVPIPGQSRVQIHRMRHHRRAEHRRGQQDRLGPVETRHQPVGHRLARWGGDDDAGDETERDHQQQAGDHSLETALAAGVLHQQQDQRHRTGEHRPGQQRQTEQQVERDCAADHLGQVGGHRHQLRLSPVRQPPRAGHPLAQGLGQRHAGDQPELGRQVLHQGSHGVGRDDHPHQQIPELGAGTDVGGHVARIDVGDRGDERRSQQRPAAPPGRALPRVLDQHPRPPRSDVLN